MPVLRELPPLACAARTDRVRVVPGLRIAGCFRATTETGHHWSFQGDERPCAAGTRARPRDVPVVDRSQRARRHRVRVRHERCHPPLARDRCGSRPAPHVPRAIAPGPIDAAQEAAAGRVHATARHPPRTEAAHHAGSAGSRCQMLEGRGRGRRLNGSTTARVSGQVGCGQSPVLGSLEIGRSGPNRSGTTKEGVLI